MYDQTRVQKTGSDASLARQFLEELISGSPFKVKGVGVDGGSEFYGDFEQAACKELGIRLFTLPLQSRKLNGIVERVKTFREWLVTTET